MEPVRDLDLYRGLEQVLGAQVATGLMDRLPSQPADQLATKADVAEVKAKVGSLEEGLAAVKMEVAALGARMTGEAGLSRERMTGQIGAVRGEMGVLREEVTGQIGAVRGEMGVLREEMTGQIGAVRSEIALLREEMTGQIGAVRGEMTGQIGQVRSEIGLLREEMTGQIGAVRGEMTGQIGAVRGEIGLLREEMTGAKHELLATIRGEMIDAIHTQGRQLAFTLAGSLVGLSGLAFALANLAAA